MTLVISFSSVILILSILSPFISNSLLFLPENIHSEYVYVWIHCHWADIFLFLCAPI